MKTNNRFYKSNISEIFVIYIHIIKLNGHTALFILENLNVEQSSLDFKEVENKNVDRDRKNKLNISTRFIF